MTDSQRPLTIPADWRFGELHAGGKVRAVGGGVTVPGRGAGVAAPGGMTYREAVSQGFAAALSRLTLEGRVVHRGACWYTDPETRRRCAGYVVTPRRVEWD